MSATTDPLGQSQYPAEAAELTITFLIPVTDENRTEVNGALVDHLEAMPDAAAVAWWADALGHYLDNQMVTRYTYKRPPMWTRPRAKRAKK